MHNQSIALCMCFSALGGILNVFATALLAYSDSQAQKGKAWSPCTRKVALLFNIFLQFSNSGAIILSSWYGPVSITLPSMFGAQLLFNMLIFGLVLRLETFHKEIRIGTYLVVIAAILLPIVGPGIQNNPNIPALLSRPGTIIWSIVMFIAMIISTAGLVLVDRIEFLSKEETKSRNEFLFNLVGQTTSTVISTTLSKMFDIVEGRLLIVILSLWIISGAVQTYFIVKQATSVSQRLFVPVLTIFNIVVNGITGFIIWNDGRVVKSFTGYACVLLLLMQGTYLMCDIDFLAFATKDLDPKDSVRTHKTDSTSREIAECYEDDESGEDDDSCEDIEVHYVNP